MSKFLKAILDVIPFNGSKTTGGLLLAITGILSQVLPALDPAAIIAQVGAHPTAIGIGLAAIGAIHRILKAKYPTAPGL